MITTIGNFTFKDTYIEGVYLIEVKSYGDSRGSFLETYRQDVFEKFGLNYKFIQDNQSVSTKNVLRGLHFQINHQQTKLVRCVYGKVFDVCVDLRKNSKTYGKWFGAVLSSSEHNQLLIPKGFAHGFVVLSEKAIFAYKCDDVYHPNDEGGLIWNDPNIGIDWPVTQNLILSDKDKLYKKLSDMNIKL